MPVPIPDFARVSFPCQDLVDPVHALPASPAAAGRAGHRRAHPRSNPRTTAVFWKRCPGPSGCGSVDVRDMRVTAVDEGRCPLPPQRSRHNLATPEPQRAGQRAPPLHPRLTHQQLTAVNCSRCGAGPLVIGGAPAPPPAVHRWLEDQGWCTTPNLWCSGGCATRSERLTRTRM